VIALVGVAVAFTTKDPRVVEGVELGVKEVSGRMPELGGPALRGGGTVSPEDLAGKVVVVNFWASWCAPCRREQPALEAVWQRYQAEDVAVIGVNYRDDDDLARAYLEEFDVSYPSIADFPGTLLGEFGIPGLPGTVVVDATGEMRFRVVGTVNQDLLEDLIERARSPRE
jgi:cytochrome c biogenesis protein CcmG, thiol:disulfide interchange protein DsbE